MNTSSGSMKSTSASSEASEGSFDNTALLPEYEELTFLKKLSETKYPVYLVFHRKTSQYYAMKCFPWEDGAPSLFFIREIRFSKLASPHLIPIIHYEFEQNHSSGLEALKFSYILMEYAKYGDFFDVLISDQVTLDDNLIRTYFHQIVKGVETLHSKGAAHLDLKLENLLMCEDFSLKITDFDLSYLKEDDKVSTKGTKNFRAPEILNKKCTDPQAADIYSMGILLFLLKTGGASPYSEDPCCKGFNLEEFQTTSAKSFWQKQCHILRRRPDFFSEDFKNLFMWMTKAQPDERPTIAQIKRSKWFNGVIYSEEELFKVMQEKLRVKVV